MFKKVFILSFLITSLFSFRLLSQDTLGCSIPMSYVSVSDSMSAEQLTSSFLKWGSKNFKSFNDVLQLKDLENSNVVLKCIFNSKYTSMGVAGNGVTYATIEFKAKNGKYKVDFADIYFQYYPSSVHPQGIKVTYEVCKDAINTKGLGRKSSIKYVIDVNSEIKAMMNSIEKSMIVDDF